MTNWSKKCHASHFYHPITTPANDLICHKIDTVHLVCVTRQVRLNFVRFEIPNLCMRQSFILLIDIPFCQVKDVNAP